MNKGSFQFLGTGASLGVPVMGCRCNVCVHCVGKNRRLRPAGLIQINDKQLLVDCGPDIRQQLLNHPIERLDGMILTHAHYDHVEGIDEMRALTILFGKALPTLLSKETFDEVKQRFYYIFPEEPNPYMVVTDLELHLFPKDRGIIDFVGIPIRYFSFEQIGMQVNGFRIGNFAYVSDIKIFPDTLFEDLAGVETLVVSALRFTPSRMHFTVDEAVDFSRQVGAKNTWLTHISHDLDHEHTNSYLPENVRMAYDGLSLDFLCH